MVITPHAKPAAKKRPAKALDDSDDDEFEAAVRRCRAVLASLLALL